MNKLKIFLSLITLFLITYVFAAVRVSKSLNNDDIKISKLLNVSKECSNLNSYKKELLCIGSIQQAQLNLIKGKRCRSKYINLGSIDVLTENTACCWDRARITEQTLKYYGFKIRHIHLLHTENLGYFSLFFRGRLQGSHAATEVLTSKGWLGVDSNERLLLIDKNNLPYTFANAISSDLVNKHTNNAFYKKQIIYVIGLYSRNGSFFEPYIPYIPEINIFDFFSNIFNIKIITPI